MRLQRPRPFLQPLLGCWYGVMHKQPDGEDLLVAAFGFDTEADAYADRRRANFPGDKIEVVELELSEGEE